MTGLTWNRASRQIPSAYQRWNEALAERFFPARQARPVYLDPDDAALAELVPVVGARGDPVDAFVESVKETLWLRQPSSFLHWQDEWFYDWRSLRRSDTPTVVALLALFSFAATRMDDDRGYYKPLCDLLNVPDIAGISRCYNTRVRHYWSALNAWIEAGGRGIPTAYPQDIRANVSLLLTQRFLSAAERGMLPVFFSQSGLTPGTTLTMAEMEDHIRRNIHLLPSDLTGEWRRHADRFAEVSAIELESWTGRSKGGDDAAATSGTLMLGLYFNRRTDKVEFPFATTSAAAPPGQYFFKGAADDSKAVACAVEELGGSVSFDADDGVRFSRGPRPSSAAVAAVLSESVEVVSRSGFTLDRGKSEAVLFLPLGPSSYIEAPGRRLPMGMRFSLLAIDSLARHAAFAELFDGAAPSAMDGCPPGWTLYRDLEFRSVPVVRDGGRLPPPIERLLPLPHDAVIDLRGGVAVAGPTRAGRAWLAAWPPVAAVVAPPDAEVQLHLRPADGAEGSDEELGISADGIYPLEANGSSLVPGDHQLFVIQGSKTLTQRKVRLVSSETPRTATRSLAHVGARGWSVVSADKGRDTNAAVRGALWSDALPTSSIAPRRPPLGLVVSPVTPDEEEADDENIVLGLARDVRPEQYRRRRRRRRVLAVVEHHSSLPGQHDPELLDAVSDSLNEFKTTDGRRWRIRYFDNDEIVVRPADGFVPLARFKVSDE